MKNTRTTPELARQTVSRRSVLDWIGQATVLALGSEVLAACSPGARHPVSSGGDDSAIDPADAEAGGADADSDADGSRDGGLGAWGFTPPQREPAIYDDWRERTVDRQDISEILARWRLRIDGLVERPVTLSFAEVLSLTRRDEVMDFHCVEGWSVLDVPWNGVHISTVLDLVDARPEATHVTFHTVNGRYNESLPLDVALEPNTLLAYGVAGHTLPLRHGFPLRLAVPRLLAYKSAKYVERLELTDHRVAGYWVAMGYLYMGEVPPRRLRDGRY
jgi:DMSO/TMAO reductase YedYZ molybdopterin-dependent catalytic subunit